LLVAGCSDPLPPAPPPYQGLSLRTDVIFATARRWGTHKLEWVEVTEAGPKLVPAPPAEKLRAPRITVLIHGYATREQDASPYFAGLIDHLILDNRHPHPIVVYDWPSLARHWVDLTVEERFAYIQFLMATVGEKSFGRIPGLPADIRWEIQEYSKDGNAAHAAGADGLLALLKTLGELAPDSTIDLIAHSMGSFVLSTALERLGSQGHRLGTIVLIAPDLDHRALEKAHWGAAKGKVHILFSGHDAILSKLSGIMNFGPRLGASGPRDRKALSGSVVLHDASDVLGPDDAHSSYLTRVGAGKVRLHELLR
jgi:esterase/lipase superfamily enzyme